MQKLALFRSLFSYKKKKTSEYERARICLSRGKGFKEASSKLALGLSTEGVDSLKWFAPTKGQRSKRQLMSFKLSTVAKLNYQSLS